MTYLIPSILFVLLTAALCLFFLFRGVRALGSGPVDLDWVRREAGGLSFAGRRHPMEAADRLPVLIITLIYAFTAFFQLGDVNAPQGFVDLAGGETISIEIVGEPVLAAGIRYYTGLGTGSYNVEVSFDGEHWSTLWQWKDDPDDPSKVTSYYWADAQGYTPDYALTQKYNQLFKWEDVTVDNPIYIRRLRITGREDSSQSVLKLGKLCLLDENGEVVPFHWALADGSAASTEVSALFDATGVPEKSTWHNSTYFDEIYHVRTALEHIEGIYPYEVTHPPLGKLILGLGVRVFGMTPFGWRFMGTLFGVLMLPILYVFLKNLFGKTVAASCGTILFAAEFMHLTQTRIATIDTYAVFFILLMYFFMYRYLTLPAGTPFKRGALPLFLSGLAWALGAACKWTVFYAGVGLAVVYFIGFYQKMRDWPEEQAPERTAWIAQTLAFSVLSFVVIPFAIYCAAYLPYAWALGVEPFAHSDQNGLALLFQNVLDKLTGAAGAEGYRAADIPRDNLLNIMANNQWYMLTYHQGVTQAHPYSSWWFQWVVDGRPILYYMDNDVAGHTTRFAAFANPVVCWAGLGAILTCFACSFRRFWSKLAFLWGFGAFAGIVTYQVQHTPNGVFDSALGPEVLSRHRLIFALCLALYLVFTFFLARGTGNCASGKCAFLTVAFLSQLVPWMFVGRTTFEYHYFPSILFLVFAIALLFDALAEEGRDWQLPVYGLTGLSVGLYALFYPVLIGLQIPTWYEPVVKWIGSWPF